MNSKLKYVILFCLICLIVPCEVYAHPGRTDASGCHYCRTNCAKWGLRSGEYHCHSGSSSSNSSSSTNSFNQSTPVPKLEKSSDNTLKSITVDGNTLTLADKMNYVTKMATAIIVVEPNHAKAKYTIDNRELVVGENNITINVKAENGNEKQYILKITRLSNNTNVKILVDGEIVHFINGQATKNVDFSTAQLNYQYILEDKKSQLEVVGDKNLTVGKNVIVFKVSAEDGTKKEYSLIVNRKNKEENTSVTTSNRQNDSLAVDGILGVGILGGTGYGIYHFINKNKKKRL